MGKHKKNKPFNDEDAKMYGGQVTNFFARLPKKKKRGRPKKNNNQGRPKNASSPTPPPHMLKSPPEIAAVAAAAAAASVAGTEKEDDDLDDSKEEDVEEEEVDEEEDDAPKKKKGRTNWGAPPHRDRMEKAINDWFKKEGKAKDQNGENVDMRIYARLVDIPFNTLYKYIHPKEENRKSLGTGERGRRKLLNDGDVQFVAETLARMDRCNDGASRREGQDLLMSAVPTLNREQAARQLSRRVIPEAHDAKILKKSVQKVQATTSDRIAISLPQQYRWHVAVDNEFAFLRETNIGLCKKSGKSFGEVMSHFIIGLDEMCIMSNAHGTLTVIGAYEKKKHEKLLEDTRISITIVRTGTCAGTTGPTIFLLKGTKKRAAFSDTFLEKHGLAPGSTIIMTENAYMTDEAWLEVSKAIVKGYRLLPYIKENPDWYMLEFLDGFKSHENVLRANELRSEAKINSLKEESQTSHVCQGYDQQVARTDKKNVAESLYDQRKIQQQQTAKANIDQYDLVLTGIRIVKQCTAETWASSFIKVNLHPAFRDEYAVFMKKISQFLRAGSQFVEEDLYPSPKKKFDMLPSWWKGMMPAERRVAQTILDSHGCKYTPDCLTQLKNECKLNLSQLTDIRVCFIIAKEHPETLDFEPGDSQNDNSASESSAAAAIEEARAETEDLNEGLDYYQLVPKDSAGKPKYSGEKLLEHMCGFRNRMFAAEVSIDDDSYSKPTVRQEPSPHLDLQLYDDNLRAIIPSKTDFNRGNVMSHAHGKRAQRKMAERKLTNIGTVVGHCGLVNSEENLLRLREQYQFVMSLAEINRITTNEKKKKESDAQKELEKSAPAAATKLETKERKVDSLTMAEMEAILFQVYNVVLPGPKSKLRKADYVKKLTEEMAKNIAKYETFLFSIRTGTTTIATETESTLNEHTTSENEAGNEAVTVEAAGVETLEMEPVAPNQPAVEEEVTGRGQRNRRATVRPSM